MYNNFYDERFRWEHMHYDRIITYGMNHIREYINNLADINENCSDVYNDLCAKNNIDKDKVKKSDKTLKFEAKLRDCYTIACNYYYELEKMKEDNLSGICVEPDVRNLFERFNNERLPIIENVSIELCPITEQDTQQQETGFAANVSEIQFPANSVRSEDAPTIAGVERGEPMTFEDAGGKNVNPNFDSEYLGYKLNCAFCIAVFEARLRGYNLEAKPADKNMTGRAKMLLHYPYYAYQTIDDSKITAPIKFKAENKKDCLKQLKEHVQEGSRYIFSYYPKNLNGLAHVIEVSKINNNLQFYDPQSNKLSDI